MIQNTDYDDDTNAMPEPTRRDYVTWSLYTVIGTVLVGYVALWRCGLI